MGSVLATSRSFSSGSVDLVARLAEHGHTVHPGPSDHELEALRPALRTAVGWIAGTGPVTAEHLDAAPLLRVVARYGVGFEAVDLRAAHERGIVVTNTPGANSAAVADHAVGLMLAVLRGTTEGDRRVRVGDWSVLRGRELGSLTVGIVGFGRIGQGVAQRLSGFGSRVLAHDPWMSAEQIEAAGASPFDLSRMAAECDIVTLHAPGGSTIVDRDWLASARTGLVLINTARPELVDEDALADALRSGLVSGFGADTLVGDTSGAASPLLAADLAARVIVTPHFGAQTVEAVDNMGSIAVTNLLAVLAGEAPPHPISTKA
ncbi:NAD(P)-dependent oxidoreductase [Cryobacterium tagatosivorans]|uniref:Hydroxyacid dehydrogenase n=1 Tax=Cryobacterium tagatosivorans TaxID=1259199 RepID=A0A4R8UH78_9MICO|nr:NAD(P)-dependent oxidoreductase [Cryobacterium tagatosivorans]TFB55946.1 hydroxyacid dehydrogenase [Cryobacterium tagatosivorans]